MTKAVSNENLALFKQKCDEIYAKVGESSKGGYQDQEYIDSRFDVGSLTYTFEGMGTSMSIPANYYYQKGSVDPNTVAISGTIDISVSGSVMLSVPFTTYAEFYCALHLCFEVGSSSGIAYDLEVQCNDIETLRSNIQTYWAFPYDFSFYKFPNAPYVYSDYGVKDFDIKIEESGQYISSGFHGNGYYSYYQVDTSGFIKNVDSKYKINFTSYSNVLPAPAPGYAGQVPVVNAAGNGYDLQAQSSGGITQSTVIERPEELPTATADSPDFVEVGGVLYRKKAVDGGVTGVVTSSTIKGVFGINYGPSVLDARVSQTINFSSNNENFSSFFADFTRGETIQYDSTTVYNGSWTNSAYRTVNFGNEEQPVNGSFYDYFRQVAYPVTPSVSYEYVAQQDAGGGGGGGTQLYWHTLTSADSYAENITGIKYVNSSSTPITGSVTHLDLLDILRNALLVKYNSNVVISTVAGEASVQIGYYIMDYNGDISLNWKKISQDGTNDIIDSVEPYQRAGQTD